MVNGLANRIRRDMETGGISQASLRHPIIFGAITGSDVPQDINRLTVVEMQRQSGTFSPMQRIKARLPEDRFYQLTRATSIAAFSIVPELVEIYPRIVEEYTGKFSKSLALDPDMRYTSAFFSVFTLMEYLGIDWKNFYREWISANEDSIVRSATVRESDSVLKEILFANVIRDQDSENPISLALMLANSNKHEDINKSSTGVYYDRQTKLLVVLVTQAVSRLLNRSGSSTGLITPTRLKDILDRHSASLTSKEIVESGVLDKLMPYMGAGIKPQDVVALHAEAWIGRSTPVAGQSTPKLEVVSEEAKNVPTANPSDYDFGAQD
jgi:hypothetical protein